MPHGSPLAIAGAAYLMTAGAVTALVLGVRAYKGRSLSAQWWLIALSYLGPPCLVGLIDLEMLLELLRTSSPGDPTFVWVVPYVGLALVAGVVRYGVRAMRDANAASLRGR
jgi:hypothetical protein